MQLMNGSSDDTDLPGRYKVVEIRCKQCGMEQPVAAQCIHCHIVFGEYYCAECKLFANANKNGIFHCDMCGIC
eukprot:SAG31_NODE_10980_length_1076_cov_1.170931_2_plen_72_part_01